MIIRMPVLAMLSALCLAACASTDATLAYRPTGGAQLAVAQAPVIASVTPVDQRKEASRRLGTIMGGFGNPIKYLNTTRPVGDEVSEVFRQALERRGLLRPGAAAPYRITVVIRKFDTDQLVGRGARTDMDMQVFDRSGQLIYQDTARTSQSKSQFFQSGIFGSLDTMQGMAQDVLDEAVDKLLDNPAFRAAIRGGVPGPVS